MATRTALIGPAPRRGLGRALDRLEHARAVAHHLVEARLALLAVAHGAEVVGGLEHPQVVVAHRHAGARLEGREARGSAPAKTVHVALVAAVLGELEALELVHALELPGQRALRAVDLEAHAHVRADDHAAGLQRPDRAAAELDQRGGPVLVLDVDELAARDAAEVRALADRQRAAGWRYIVAVRPLSRSIGPTR